MASGKLSPRQKMINMMYLVLTALLAMNVSSEILNAFETVNKSLETTVTILKSKVTDTYSAFDDAKLEPGTREKANLWEPVAKEVSAKSDAMYAFLDDYKNKIKDGAGRVKGEKDEFGNEVFKRDDLDVATRVFIESPTKDGIQLYNKMNTYRDEVLAILKKVRSDNPVVQKQLDTEIDNFKKTLPINMSFPVRDHDGKAYAKGGEGWAYSSFHMTPAIAAITILSKLQSDIKGTEGTLTDFCLTQIGKVKIVYDKFAAVAQASTTYCMPGEEIIIKAGVGAFNDAAKPVITIGGSTIPLTDGMAIKKMNAGQPGGPFTIPVSITFTKPDGTTETKREEIKYTVGQPSGAALMLDKMNVFYIGLDNPVTVSSGTGDEKTILSASGGGITLSKKGPGKYNIRATTIGEANISIKADQTTTSYKFRVKRVPDPVATIGGTITTGKTPKGTMAVQQGIVAKLENFDFDAKFEVVSYEFVFSPRNSDLLVGNCSGPMFSSQLQGYIKNSKPKDQITIENIKVKGPDGSLRKIPGLSVILM